MPTRSHDIFIPAPADVIFEAIADVASHPAWRHGLVRCESRAARQVGGRAVEVRRVLGRDVEHPYEITEFDPARRWAMRVTAGFFRPRVTVVLLPRPDGTLVTVQITLDGLVGSLFGWMVIGAEANQEHANYERLGDLLTAGKLPRT